MTEQASCCSKTKASQGEKTEPVRAAQTYFTPRVDVWETPSELLFHADMPGVKPEDVSLHYENGVLTLRATVQPATPHNKSFLQEYAVGDYYRTFTVNEEVDPGKIHAQFKLGVLTVKLPKREEVKPRQIAITAS
jgi:HSP20 family protein